MGEGRTESLKMLSISEVINSYKIADNKKSKSVIPNMPSKPAGQDLVSNSR